MSRLQFFSVRQIALAVLITGTVLSFAAGILSHRFDTALKLQQYEDDVRDEAREFLRHFDAVRLTLNSLVALAAASREVTPEEFAVFTDALILNIDEHSTARAAIREFGWIDLDAGPRHPAYVRTFEGRERPTSLLPRGRNAVAAIFDSGGSLSDTVIIGGVPFSHHDSSGQRATDSLITLLGPVMETSRGGAVDTRGPIRAAVFEVVDIEVLIAAARRNSTTANMTSFRFVDNAGSEAGRGELTRVGPAVQTIGPRALRTTLAGRPVELTFGPHADAVAAGPSSTSIALTVIGLVLTALLAFYLVLVGHQNEAFEEARNAAEHAHEQKARFLANMSHELRTPMNGIIGMAHMIGMARLDANQRDYLDSLLLSADGLLHVLNDILEFSRAESGHIRMAPEPTDIVELMLDVRMSFWPLANEKNIDLIADFDDEVPRCVEIDPVRLRQVMTNLVSNAIKFTREGKVVIHLSGRRLSGPEAIADLTLTVSDTGIGIPEEAHPRIFERFFQADNSSTKEFGGTGLGLAICKQFMGLMGGSISFKSAAGEGTTFTVTLTAPIADPVSETEGAKAASRRIPPARVLAAGTVSAGS